MLLELKQVFSGERLSLGFSYKLDLSGYEFAGGEYPFKTPVEISGGVENRAGVVNLKLKAAFVFTTKCDRCCKDIAEQYSFDFENILVNKLNQDDGADELLLVSDEKLDIDEYTVSNIILNLPSKHLCREDCKGICPSCGKDLNIGPCGCEGKEPDTRLDPLKKLLK